MFYLKHPHFGNRHVATLEECQRMQSEGWTRWPRSKAEKEGRLPVIETAPADPLETEAAPLELPKRRGRPPKVQ